jgi:hypothetical protein
MFHAFDLANAVGVALPNAVNDLTVQLNIAARLPRLGFTHVNVCNRCAGFCRFGCSGRNLFRRLGQVRVLASGIPGTGDCASNYRIAI